MKWKTILLLFVLSCSMGNIGWGAEASVTEYEALRDTIRSLKIDTTSSREVQGIFIQDGVFTITLDSGVMTAMEPVDGRQIGFLFSGKGTAMFQPRLLTEQVNLERFYEQRMFMEEFESAIILNTDNVVADQLAGFADAPLVESPYNESMAEAWARFALDGEEYRVPSSIARQMLNKGDNHYFQIQINRMDLSAYIIHDPFDIEPYSLFLEKLGNKLKFPTLVNRCPIPGPTPVKDEHGVEPGDLVEMLQHTIDASFDNGLDLVAQDRIAMDIIADSLMWLDLSLFPTLKIDSITIVRGDSLPMYHAERSFTTWVQLPRWYKKGEQLELMVYYHGDIIERIRDYTILQSSITWYPSHSYSHKAYFDVTYTYPDHFVLSGIGSQNEFRSLLDKTKSRWVTGRRVRNASFHIGKFKRMDVETPNDIPKAAILYNTPDQVDMIALDIKQSLEFFTKFFGQVPVDSLVATELPGWHGEAFPGLLHLSSQAFDPSVWDDEQFFEEQFIAHEVGHQWWGIAVDYGSYRDRWISEGFAQYSAMMYTQQAAGDKDRFWTNLDNYRNEIISFGRKTIGRDLPPPPIALGHRASDGTSGRSGYSIFIYNKGAWVLHMLRNLLLDLNTMKEDAFISVMRSFYHSHKNRHATTEDFQRAVEDVVGQDMGWFFDQWVYGNQIPSFTWAYASEEQSDGTYANKIRVKQENVEESFRSYIPIKVVYDDGTWARYRVQMRGRQATLELPASKTEIDEIIFNEFLSVLCEQDEESF